MPPRVAVVVLAAGGSTRLGRPKQLLVLGGRSMVRGAVEDAIAAVESFARSTSSALDNSATALPGPVFVVLGAAALKVREELRGLRAREVLNEQWAAGLATSIVAGVAAAEAEGVDAVLFTTCDQPLVTADDLAGLLAVYGASRAPIVAAQYERTLGIPAIFTRDLFAALRRLTGDAGAKRIIEEHRGRVVRVPCAHAAFDVDTADAWEHLT